MKIKDITPKVETIFSIELTENQLKLLSLIVGDTTVYNLKELVDTNELDCNTEYSVEMEDEFTQNLYNLIVDAID
jgi:hypothetical protein